MNRDPEYREVHERCLALLEAVSPDMEVGAIAPEDSLSSDLMLDSFMLASLVDQLERAFPDVDMTPWFMSATQDGGDTVGDLVAFVLEARAEARR